MPDQHGVSVKLKETDQAYELEATDGCVQGMSPADLDATISTMKRVAMRRMSAGVTHLPTLRVEDLEEALGRVQPRF